MSAEHSRFQTIFGRMRNFEQRTQDAEAQTQVMSPAPRRSSLAPASARQHSYEDTAATLFGRTLSPFYVRSES
jgi:hypothetical protein